jgi:hypothetical protein
LKKSSKSKIILLSLAIFAAALLVYANTLTFGLSYLDDNNHIHTLAKDYDSKTAIIDAFKWPFVRSFANALL